MEGWVDVEMPNNPKSTVPSRSLGSPLRRPAESRNQDGLRLAS